MIAHAIAATNADLRASMSNAVDTEARREYTVPMFIVLNADGIQVAEYANSAHADESAYENALAGSAEMGDFYTVHDTDTDTEGASWKATSTGAERM